ncbi:carboxypeptidase-like regulatory domain-containing protein [candidate division KSB1 bacterium]|nr:carboxypeptidase-like regulatory domain-containing protein [candidate division KSB1 bacterium]
MTTHTLRKNVVVITLLSGIYFSAGSLYGLNNNSELSGHVFVDRNKTPLVSANVQLINSKIGEVTNEQGFFSLKNLPYGNDTLLVSFMGYIPIKTAVSIPWQSNSPMTIYLKEAVIEMPEVSISEWRFT